MCDLEYVPRSTYLRLPHLKPDEGLIFHSNSGPQSTSEEFARTMNHFNMIHTFSYKGHTYNNVCIESFHDPKARRSKSCSVFRF